MYSGIISKKMPDHHLDDQALIFSGKEPSREQTELPQESPQEPPFNIPFRVRRYKSIVRRYKSIGS